MKNGCSVSIRGLSHRFGSTQVLEGIDLELASGEVLALLGPSGSGKTTLLRLIAGLLPPSDGQIMMGGQVVAAPDVFVPPEQRGLGMVFQDYALWPHLSVEENVAFPLSVRKVSKAERQPRVQRALERVGLAALASRTPSALSGGQQQRVALARAIVAEPKIILFDEPLSNLDRELRESLCDEIGELLRSMGTTAIYVTHDHEEAFSLADRVAVMNECRIRQLDIPDTLIKSPATVTVAAFLKLGALLPSHVVGAQIQTVAGALQPPADWLDAQIVTRDQAGHLFVPNAALSHRLHDEADFHGEIVSQRFRAGSYETVVQLGASHLSDGLVTWIAPSRLPMGETVSLKLDWARARWLQ